MSDNWVVQNLENALNTWNEKLAEIWQLVTQSPEQFKGGTIWNVIVNIHGALQAIGLALLVLFFVVGVMRTCGNFAEVKKPEHALKLFIRFALAKGAVTYGLELMMALFKIVQGVISTIMNAAGFGTAMFLEYSELLNALDSGATTKITINNRRLNKADFEQTILIPMSDDGLDKYRTEYNKMLLDKATGANSIVQDKYVTVSVCKKNIEEARNYFARVGTDLIAHFSRIGSKCTELEAEEKLRIFHDFYRTGEETAFRFDMSQTMRKGHDFKDFICPDTFEFEKDYFRMGDRYGRVIFLREYAAYIKDSMVAELCELNRNMMLSVDVIPGPTDEAVREVENRLLGVETNITNWQRKQLQPIGMLVVLDSILNRITQNRAKGRNTFIFIDEIYLLFQHEYSANFLFTLWKRVRKYGAYCTGITQNVDDLLQSHTARTMLANSEFIIMLNQASTDRIELAKHIFALADRGIIGNALGIWGLLHQLGYLLKGFGLFVHLCIVVIHLKAAKNRRCEKQYGGSYTNLHLIFFH